MLELLVSLVGGFYTLRRYSNWFGDKDKNYGCYCVCYLKKGCHIPWKTYTFTSEVEYENVIEDIVVFALDKTKNLELRNKDITGIAVINVASGDEEYVCMLSK